MTLLTVVRDVCAVVGVTLPPSVFGNINTDRTAQEMLALANEVAQRIAYDTRDWRALIGAASYDGTSTPVETNGSSVCPLPSDYKRMLLTSNVRRNSQPSQALQFIPDIDAWLESRTSGDSVSSSGGEWTIFSDTMRIYPRIAEGDTAGFIYLDKNCVRLAGGGFGDRFIDDADSYRLDERLLKLGMIWQWKAQKGSSYAEDLGTYGDALTNAMGHDKPAPIIIDRRPISAMRGTYFGDIP